jgi:membrane-associated phospholipid phosphatase
LPLVDPTLHALDLLLGIDVEAVTRGSVSIPGLPALLVAAYNSSFPILFLSALIFVWTGRSRSAWELCFVFNICLLVTTISSAIIPATGPFHYLQFSVALQQALPPGAGTFYLADLFALRDADRFIVDPSQLQGVAVFPSFHAMLGVMTAAAWRDFPRIRIAMCAWQGLVILSAIPIGGHYASDLVAGGMCWALVQLLWRRIMDGPSAEPSIDDIAPAYA